MPESLERLKEFRAQYDGPERPGRWVKALEMMILVLGFGGVFALLAFGGKVHAPRPGNGGGLDPDSLRRYAVYLEERNLPGEALAAYENYLDRADLDTNARAQACYAVARVAIDAGDHEKALAYLYQSEMLAPDSGLKEDIDRKVSLCLEKLGRTEDLRRELRRRSDLARRDTPDEGDRVLAEFGDEVVTDRDLRSELEKLPASVREEFSAPERQEDLLRNLVAERLLVDRARRLELDKDPEVQDALVRSLDAMIVRKLIDDTLEERIAITPGDVERFYRAEIDRFSRPATARVKVATGETPEAAAHAEPGGGETLAVRQGAPIPGLPGSQHLSDLVFQTGAGDATGPVEFNGTWYVCHVVSAQPARVQPFEEVREQAVRMLRQQKEQEELQALIEETLRARKVRLYPERLGEDGEG